MSFRDEDGRQKFRIVALVLLENVARSNTVKFNGLFVGNENMGRINTPANGIYCSFLINFSE
jgi:hypothetical protein